MNHSIYLPFLSLLISLSSTLSAQTAAQKSAAIASTSDVQQQIENLLLAYQQKGAFNGVVCVLENGETVYEQAFGYADGAQTTPLTPQFRFGIGSIYKEFPAVAIMQLQEQQRLSVEDPVSQYLTELPAWAETVSIKQLMQYSSGLPKIDWRSLFSSGVIPTDAIIMDFIKGIDSLEFAPGTDYLYTNCSPILLIKIVEEITQQAFPDYLAMYVFEPHGLTNTVLQDAYPYPNRALMAMPFAADFAEDGFRIAAKSLLFTASAGDLAKWINALDSFQVVRKSSVELLSQSHQNNPAFQSPLGQCSWEKEDILEHAHHGSSGNYECLVSSYKQEGLTIAITTNQKNGNVHQIVEEIYQLVRKKG
ncbi:MAG: serine hydrolase domain-containing protein [Saprospiraceae bacterium]